MRALPWPTRSAAPGRSRAIGDLAIVPRGESAAALDALPLAALRVDDEIVDRAGAIGLETYPRRDRRGRARRWPRASDRVSCAGSIRRFGREEESITPRLPVPSCTAEQRFAEPIGLEADVLGTIEKLARELSAAMERRGEGARLLQVALFRADGKVFASMPRPASRCAIPRASGGCFPNALPRSATKPIPASATTCCGCRRSWSSAWIRCRPGSRATIIASSWRIWSTG